MAAKTITIHVKMDRKILRSFALFDTFRLKKQWKKPLLFASIMLVFAVICFLMTDKEQNVMLGTLLLIVGFMMPFSYVFMFLNQLNEQAKKLRLDPPRRVYSLSFSTECIDVINDMKTQEPVRLEWQKLGGAFRTKKAVYLYVTRDRAFILPDGQADAPQDELWEMIADNLPQGRAQDKR